MKLQSCVFPALAVFLLSFGGEPCRAAVGDENWDAYFGVPGMDGAAGGIAVAGTNVYFGGSFSQIGGVNANNVAMWNGSNWVALGGGVSLAAFPLVGPGGSVYFGGAFSQAGGAPANHVAKWDGTNWSALGDGIAGQSIDTGVSALALFGADLYVGGNFSRAGGLTVSNIAKWNGTEWADVGGGVNGWVYTMAATGRDLYVGGAFTLAGSLTVNYVAKWDGTNWSALADPGSAPPWAILATDSGVYLYAVRSERMYEPRFGFLRWNGASWDDVASGTFILDFFDGRAQTSQLVANGRDFYITGNFGGIGSVRAPGVAKWDGTNWSGLGQGVQPLGSTTYGLASSGSELFVGGNFDHAGGKPSAGIALWHIPHSLTVNRSDDSVALSWPATGTNFVLESLDTFGQTNWAEVPQPFSIVNDQCVVTNDISATNRFYRLRRR